MSMAKTAGVTTPRRTNAAVRAVVTMVLDRGHHPDNPAARKAATERMKAMASGYFGITVARPIAAKNPEIHQS